MSPDAQDTDSRDLLGQVRPIRAFRLARESLEYLPEEDWLIRQLVHPSRILWYTSCIIQPQRCEG